MNNYQILQLHGLPAIGVDGSCGNQGKKGKGIYFGYINDFFESIDYTVTPYLYAEQYNTDIEHANDYNRRMNESDTAYYTGFTPATPSNPNEWEYDLNKFIDSENNVVFREIHKIKTSAGVPFSTIYKYDSSAIENDTNKVIPSDNCMILVDMQYINMDTSSGFNLIQNLRFKQAPDKIDSSIFHLQDISTGETSIERFPFYSSPYPDRNELTEDVSNWFDERAADFQNDPSIGQKKLNDNIGYVYYHTPFDPWSVKDIENQIVESIYGEKSEITESPKIPLFVNDTINTSLNWNQQGVSVSIPVTLKEEFKEGDILYIWKEGTGYVSKEIEYMIILTKELEGADYNTIIANVQKIKPFNLFQADIIDDRFVLFNNINITKYELPNYVTGNNDLINTYTYNFAKCTDSESIFNISNFNDPYLLNFVHCYESSTNYTNIGLSGILQNNNLIYKFSGDPVSKTPKLYIDTDVYLNEETTLYIPGDSSVYKYPELGKYILLKDIIFDNDLYVQFNFNDNYIPNTKPYIFKFLKSEMIKNNIDIYNFDIISWYTITDSNSSLVFNSNVYHHYFMNSPDNEISIDFTDEIITTAKNNLIYSEYPLMLNILIRVFSSEKSYYYTKPFYIKFTGYDSTTETFSTTTGSITAFEEKETIVNEDDSPLVLFNLSENLSWEAGKRSTIIVTLNSDKHKFVSTEVDDQHIISVHYSDNVTTDGSEEKEFICSSTAIYVNETTLNLDITTNRSLISDYSDATINSITDLLNYGQDSDDPLKSLEQKQAFTNPKKLSKVGSLYCYIGIDIEDISTGEIQTCYYTIYQNGIQDFRVKPEVSFYPRIKNNELEKTNNIDNGILCNQFQYFVDFKISNFDYSTWGYLIKNNLLPQDTSVLLDLTFTINSFSNQADVIQASQISGIVSNYSTIHFLDNNIDDLKNNKFKFKFDGYININPETITAQALNEYSNDNIISDTLLKYQDISTNLVPRSIAANMVFAGVSNSFPDSSNGGVFIDPESRDCGEWYNIPLDGFISNNPALKYSQQHIGIYSDNTVTFKNISLQDIENNTYCLRIYFEEDNPLLTYLNYDIALQSSKVTIILNDSSTYTELDPETGAEILVEIPATTWTYTFDKDNFYIDNIPSKSENSINYLYYTNSTGNKPFVINPISLIGSTNTDKPLVTMQGFNYIGPEEEVTTRTTLYNPKISDKRIYEYFGNSENYLNSLVHSNIVGSILLPRKNGLQDNVKAISIDPINPIELKNTTASDFYKLYNSNLKYNNIYVDITDNIEQDELSYLALRYNALALKTKRKQGQTFFNYNDWEYDITPYNQIATNTGLFVEANSYIQQRSDDELSAIESWNYEYEISYKYNENNVFGGVLTKSGNGYMMVDINDPNLKEKYVTDEIMALEDLQTTQKSYIVTDSYDTISYEDLWYTDTHPEDGEYYRSILWSAYWQYPKYTKNYILNYNFAQPSISSKGYEFVKAISGLTDVSLGLNISTSNKIKALLSPFEDYIENKFGITLDTSTTLNNILKQNSENVYQYIPYNLCYQIYPRVIINLNTPIYTTYNILMLRKPTIGTEDSSIIKREFPIETINEDYSIPKTYILAE